MRSITSHIVDGDVPQNQLRIEVGDPPGSGGASHVYRVVAPVTSVRVAIEAASANQMVSVAPDGQCHDAVLAHIAFQNGPILENGLNGITNEALLAIVLDRLDCFQQGPFACDENGIALEHVYLALLALKLRTARRIARGVEGKEGKI